MTDAEILRRDHAALIAEDQVAITVHRVSYVDDGAGGRAKVESDLPTFNVRLVPQSASRPPAAVTSEAGQEHIADVLLLAPWDVDLQAGSDVEDSFSVNGRRYVIRRVTARQLQGQTYALQAAIEEVS